MKWSPSSVKHVLAVASCKGGVGKTTVSVNLAFALRRSGARVGLFDADLYGPNVPLMLGIRRSRASFPLKATDRRQRSVSFIPLARADTTPYIKPLRRYGIHVMSLGLWFSDTEAISDDPSLGGQMIRQTLQDVDWGDLDFLLLDFPPGTGEPQQTLLATIRIDGVIVVTTPQELSLMDTGRSLALFARADVPILGVVENMSFMVCPMCGAKLEVFDRPESGWPGLDRLPVLGRVPLDRALGRRIDPWHPMMQLSLDSPQASAFRQVADRVRELTSRG